MMVEIGKINSLRVTREVEFGFYLDGEEKGEILLPRKLASNACRVDEPLDVFIYLDSEERLVATTQTPHVCVGEFALLRVSAIEDVGAFMDWGLSKELLVPFREQRLKLSVGRSYITRAYLDERSNRIVGSTKLDRFLGLEPCGYKPDEAVDLLIAQRTDLGYKAIVNDAYWGVLYHNEVFQRLDVGQALVGYVKKVRDDGKIDLLLEKPGYEKIGGIAGMILDLLKENGGFLPITAKTSPDEIHARFGVSKKNYKKALGSVYKQRLVSIDSDGIRLTKS
ncbi:MAG: GntR family transcriptional regulator [Verrucomicrobia bacterium]|nr:GntR family transcriptional regulator [Verrucomicrobiota bacterium]